MGWGWFLLSNGPWCPSGSRHESGAYALNPDLATGRWLGRVLEFVPRTAEELAAMEGSGFGSADSHLVYSPSADHRYAIAQVVLTQILALAAGTACLLFEPARPALGGSGGGLGPGFFRRRGKRWLVVLAALPLLLGGLAWRSMPMGDPEPYFPVIWSEGRVAHTGRLVFEAPGGYARPLPLAAAGRERQATEYRLLWLPSFDHSALVHLSRSPSGGLLGAIVVDGLGGYEPGHVALDKTVALRNRQWAEIERRIDLSGFWSLATKRPDDGGSDGDQLVLEGLQNGRYHVVDRWEPEKSYLELCTFLFDLGDAGVTRALMEYHTPRTP